MLLLLLNYVALRALWKIDVHLISTLVNKSLYYYLYYNQPRCSRLKPDPLSDRSSAIDVIYLPSDIDPLLRFTCYD